MTTLFLPSLWNDAKAKTFDEKELLVYRCKLLESHLGFKNFSNPSTSAKLLVQEPLTGRSVQVLLVKTTSGKYGITDLGDFATVYLDKVAMLRSQYKTIDQEHSLALDLRHCVFNLNPCAPSAETFLHGFAPHGHVDLTHFDAINSIVNAENSEQFARNIFGKEIAYLKWQRPGIDLGIKISDLVSGNPELVGIILGNHGLLTWGETSRSCYKTTLRITNKAVSWVNNQVDKPGFGGQCQKALGSDERKAVALRLMPEIRGIISSREMKIGHFSDTTEVLEFVNSKDLLSLVSLNSYNPASALHSKIGPLVIASDATRENLTAHIGNYCSSYEAYYNRYKSVFSPKMRDPTPAIFLVPQLGMFTFAADKTTAKNLSEAYTSSIAVMHGASTVSRYQGLSSQELFNIEYWPLEEEKILRRPKPSPLSGRIALVTGAANGIGAAIAERLLLGGACVTLADIDADALDKKSQALAEKYGNDNVLAKRMDVTIETEIIAGFNYTACHFGGLDIVVNNAGIAIRSPVEDTTLEMWDKQVAILGTGYFLVGREGFRLLKRQNRGGSMIFISSKNGLIASEGASAYGAMKAAELHMARSMALEGAPFGIRVNSVTPDAVLRGSKLMADNFAQKRAEALNIRLDELDEYYRKRSLLQRSVYSEDVAEAAYFFASDLSQKSTGNIINVDAGHVASFTR